MALFTVMCAWPSRLAAEGHHLNRWAYPPYSLVVISTGVCGSAAGLASGIGIFVKRERSLLAISDSAWGLRIHVLRRRDLPRSRIAEKILTGIPPGNTSCGAACDDIHGNEGTKDERFDFV